MQINNSIEYLRMIELNINAYQTFITKDIILPINILSIDLKENGRFPILESTRNESGDVVIVTGDNQGSFVRYTFTE